MKIKSKENDSDIDGFGYESSSSGDAQIMMFKLENLGNNDN
jgi:hypothetical protein